MSAMFEELDYRPTPIGAVSLRRRRELVTNTDIYEIKLGEEHLMSSLFTTSEVALGKLGVEAASGSQLSVVVGGLGLGYTAAAVLADPRVAELSVIEFLEPVIDWHGQGLVPLGHELTRDSRCTFVHGDFFAMARSAGGFDTRVPGRKFDAVLVDIDHSPELLLDARSTGFYSPDGLLPLSHHLVPEGVFGLWSNDLPDQRFIGQLQQVFHKAWAEQITFDNPLQGNRFTQTVYLARTAK